MIMNELKLLYLPLLHTLAGSVGSRAGPSQVLAGFGRVRRFENYMLDEW
jgi:hypothetical protein